MNYSDVLPYTFPLVLLLGFWYIFYKRSMRPVANSFKDGSAQLPLARTIEVSCHISEKDFEKANWQVTKSSKWILGYSVLLPTGVIVSQLTTSKNFDPLFLIPALLLSITIMPVLSLLSIKFSSKALYNRTEFIKHPVTYMFTSEGYHINSSVVTQTSKWDMVRGYKIVKDFVLVYNGPATALFLPNAAFKSLEDYNTFTTFLKANFSKV